MASNFLRVNNLDGALQFIRRLRLLNQLDFRAVEVELWAKDLLTGAPELCTKGSFVLVAVAPSAAR